MVAWHSKADVKTGVRFPGSVAPIHRRPIVAGADMGGMLMRSEKLLWQPKVAIGWARPLAVVIQPVVGDGAWPLTANR